MKTFKELIEKANVVSTLDIPGALASFLDKKFGKNIKILDTGKEYRITIVKETLNSSDLKSLTLNGLDSIELDSAVLKIRK